MAENISEKQIEGVEDEVLEELAGGAIKVGGINVDKAKLKSALKKALKVGAYGGGLIGAALIGAATTEGLHLALDKDHRDKAKDFGKSALRKVSFGKIDLGQEDSSSSVEY